MGIGSLGISPETSAMCARLILGLSLLIPYSILIFSYSFPSGTPFSKPIFFLLAMPIIFLAYFLFGELVIRTVSYGKGFMLTFGPLNSIFTYYYLIYSSIAGITLFFKYIKSTHAEKMRYKYFVLGLFIAFSVALFFNVILFSVFGLNQFVYFGPFASILVIVPTAYAILKYRLMDISLVIKKTTAYSLMTTAITFIYVVVVLTFEFLFRSAWGYYSYWAAVPAALVIAVTFTPMRNYLQGVTDRVFFRRMLEYQTIIKDVTRTISSVTDLETLFRLIDRTVVRAMCVRDVAVLLLEKKENYFLVEKTNGLADEVMYRQFSLDNPLAAYLREKKDAVVMDELIAQMASGVISPPEKKELDMVCSELKSLTASVAIPSFIKDKLVGILCLGEKLSGEPYSSDDLELLLTMASEAGIAIENAKLYRDITATRDYLNNLIQNSEDAIVTLDLDGKVLTWNEGARKIFGYEASEIIGKTPPDIAEDEFRENLNRILNGESLKAFETRAKNKNGSEVPLLLTASPAHDSQGKIIGIFTIMKDLTERKRTEEALKQSQEQLVLSERLASLGRIAAGVAHELNNPLTGVLGMSQLMLEETKKGAPLREELEIIEESALRCKQIIQSLLSFAQKTMPEFKKINLKDSLDQSLRLIKKQLTLKEIQLKTDLPPLTEIDADSGQLTQVFLNLLYNSIEAVKQKGTIKIQAQEDKGNNRLILTFEDNGAGIDTEYLPHIFEPFFTTKKKEKGSGLGLSISYGIIQAHNGTIECRSKKGKGTTFTIKLPIKQSGKEKTFDHR